MHSAEATFPSPDATLFLRSVTPANPTATLGIIHGYGDHSGRFLHFMRWLADRGIASHAFDLRGQGKSTGRYGYVRRWTDYLADLRAFLDLDVMNTTPRFLLGHSHGGLILAAAGIDGLLANVQGCIFTSPFFKSRLAIPRFKILLAKCINPILPGLHIKSGLANEMMTSDPAMIADTAADPLVRRVATPRWFTGMTDAQSLVASRAADFRTPFLMLTGDADPIADPSGARQFVERVGSAKKDYKSYPGLLHELLRERDREAVFADVLTWITTHVTPS